MFDESPEFVSYRGLYKTAFNHTQLLQTIEYLLELVRKSHENAATNQRGPDVRLLDTFFSDTLNEAQLTEIIYLCRDFSSALKILILNPYSAFANARGKSLKQDPVTEINKAVMKLRRAMSNARDLPLAKLNTASEEDLHSKEFLNQQLDHLRSERGEIGLSIKFYEVMTEMPVYIISNFAAKGLIVDHLSAAYNPWMIFVDNPRQKGDIFDCLKKSFDTIWNNSSIEKPTELTTQTADPDVQNKIFISQAHNSPIAKRICEYLGKTLDFEVEVYNTSATPGRSPFENLESMTSSCSYAVIVLTMDDEVNGRPQQNINEDSTKNRKRGRQNVIHEIGYCQAKMGVDHVLILRERGVEVPSNIDYLHGAIFEGDDIQDALNFLVRHLIKNG